MVLIEREISKDSPVECRCDHLLSVGDGAIFSIYIYICGLVATNAYAELMKYKSVVLVELDAVDDSRYPGRKIKYLHKNHLLDLVADKSESKDFGLGLIP